VSSSSRSSLPSYALLLLLAVAFVDEAAVLLGCVVG